MICTGCGREMLAAKGLEKKRCGLCRSKYNYHKKMGIAETKALDSFRECSKLWLVQSPGFSQNMHGARA